MSLMERIAQTAGFDAAVKIAASYGGLTLYIPDRANPRHALVELIGLDAFVHLIGEFGGQTINPPRLDMRPFKRAADVRLMAKAGMTPRCIARVMEISEARVRQILLSEDAHKAQEPLL